MSKSKQDNRIIKLVTLFFILCVALFVLGLIRYKLNYYGPHYATQEDYVIFQKDQTWLPCKDGELCEQHYSLYRSGKFMGLGAKMVNTKFTAEKLMSVVDKIQTSEIFDKDCTGGGDTGKTGELTYTTTYTIKQLPRVKTISLSGCTPEILLIESAVFN